MRTMREEHAHDHDRRPDTATPASADGIADVTTRHRAAAQRAEAGQAPGRSRCVVLLLVQPVRAGVGRCTCDLTVTRSQASIRQRCNARPSPSAWTHIEITVRGHGPDRAGSRGAARDPRDPPGFDRSHRSSSESPTSAQAAPPSACWCCSTCATGTTGFWIGVLPIAFYSLLPVLRNTILGYQEVDPTLSTPDADRGCRRSRSCGGSSSRWPCRTSWRGCARRWCSPWVPRRCASSSSAGGLGILIDTGYKLNRDNVTLVVGAVLAVALALLVDWLGALAETYLGPKGLR